MDAALNLLVEAHARSIIALDRAKQVASTTCQAVEDAAQEEHRASRAVREHVDAHLYRALDEIDPLSTRSDPRPRVVGGRQHLREHRS